MAVDNKEFDKIQLYKIDYTKDMHLFHAYLLTCNIMVCIY